MDLGENCKGTEIPCLCVGLVLVQKPTIANLAISSNLDRTHDFAAAVENVFD